MDVDELAIIGPGVDYTQVGAIHQKRTLAFVNHFITRTVYFLNNFARSCETRLEKFDEQVQKLEASLHILEAKLSSISGLNDVTSASSSAEPTLQAESIAASIDIKPDTPANPADEPPPSQAVQQENTNTAAQDVRFVRFFRMVQVGVPIQAVRLKMKAEGLDPTILDNPDTPVFKQSATSNDVEESSDTHSASSFSD